MFTYYQHQIRIPAGRVRINCELTIPARAKEIIVFAQAEGSSRLSGRSRCVAQHLQRMGFGTLLPDLLTPEEVQTSGKKFDIDLLTARLMTVTEWLKERDLSNRYRVGYYASSTGTAAALQAAAYLPEVVGAIVSRGGRPDLVPEVLERVEAPTLLIVGELDRYVGRLNREALDRLHGARELKVIDGASHLFEGNKMDEVAVMAAEWFALHLQGAAVAHA